MCEKRLADKSSMLDDDIQAQNKLEWLERKHVQILVYKVYAGCLHRNNIVGKHSCARHQRNGATNIGQTYEMPATFPAPSSQGGLGAKTYNLQNLRTSHVNGISRTLKEETDMADTPQRTEKKISGKLTSEHTERTLSPEI
jgi:hypothetical protein